MTLCPPFPPPKIKFLPTTICVYCEDPQGVFVAFSNSQKDKQRLFVFGCKYEKVIPSTSSLPQAGNMAAGLRGGAGKKWRNAKELSIFSGASGPSSLTGLGLRGDG